MVPSGLEHPFIYVSSVRDGTGKGGFRDWKREQLLNGWFGVGSTEQVGDIAVAAPDQLKWVILLTC